ncbi:MAG: SAM-dependent methyltransferase [Acidimicrobiia bacterium]
MGPLFGVVVARALDRWWHELRRPDPFVVVEAGAGSGTLAGAVLAARPECSAALRYVLVERSPRWRERQSARLPLEPAGMVLGPMLVADSDLGPQPLAGIGPLVTALAELPVGPFEGVVLANELLDNLPFRLLERAVGGRSWSEVRVTADLQECLVEAAEPLAAEADRLAPEAAPGARIPLQHAAAAWLRTALAALARGRVVVVDYADTTSSMAARPWTDWLRTYRAHGRGGRPLDDLGHQDVTCEVALDQLAAVAPPAADRTQADFLRLHGVDDVADAAGRLWQERAHIGDLEALKSRSTVSEAAALTDPTGLGAFRVLEWVRA